MKLNKTQIQGLTELLKITREKELNCNEALELVAEYAEAEIEEVKMCTKLEAVQHHLSLCAECREEYESLQAAIKGLGDDE